MKPARVLLICAMDALVAQGLVDLQVKDSPFSEQAVYCTFVFPDGVPGVASARSIGFGELTIVAIYGTTDTSLADWCAASGASASTRTVKKVNAWALGWLERKTGIYLQGSSSNDRGSILCSVSREADTAIRAFEGEVANKQRQFGVEGKFVM